MTNNKKKTNNSESIKSLSHIGLIYYEIVWTLCFGSGKPESQGKQICAPKWFDTNGYRLM